jgi:cell division septal protein FtsQ
MARIRSKDYKERKTKNRRQKLLVWALVICLILCGFVGITRWEPISIQTYTIPKNTPLTKTEIKQAVESGLDQQFLGLINRDNVILFNGQAIRSNIRSLSSQVKRVGISVSGLRSIAITIDFYKPVAKICDRERVCNYLSPDGYVFSATDQSVSERLPPFVASKTDRLAGTYLLPPAQFRALTDLVTGLSDINLTPKQVEFSAADTITITTGQSTSSTSTEIRVKSGQDLRRIYRDLKTSVNRQAFMDESGEKPIDPSTLEYIDMRFENKIFYK